MSASNLPLWGQAWELTVTAAAAGSTAENPLFEQTVISYKTWSPEALRVTFEVTQAMNTSPLWYADISIYNLANAAQQNILLNATWATLQAGFQSGPNQCATIWSGPVFQTILTREDVVDQKVTLHCVANPLIMDQIVSFSMNYGSSQAHLLTKMSEEINAPPISADQGTLGPVAAQRTAAVQYPRGNTVFGRVNKYLAQIADSNFLQSWIDGKQTYVSEVNTGKTTIDYIYSPAFPPGGTDAGYNLPAGTTQSIIGTPEQIQQGVVFTVLLDPRLKVALPPLLVQLVRTTITQLVRTPFVNSDLPTMLAASDNANLTFWVAQIRHIGDTRGNDWHTEVTGYSTAYADTLLNLFTPTTPSTGA